MWFQHKSIRYPYNFFSVVIICLVLLATFRIAINNGMQKTLADPGWYCPSICGAISSLKYGRNGYVCYKKVLEKLNYLGELYYHPSKDPQAANRTIQQALTLEDPARDGISTMAGMDSGYIDYCRLAFILFGYNVESLFYTYLLLFLIPVLIFFVTFRENKVAILILITFLLAHYVTVKAWSSLDAVQNYRFMYILAILPLIHILMLTLLDRPLRFCAFIGTLIQSIIFTFVLWIRSSILWMGALLVIYSILRLSKGMSAKTKLWPVWLALCIVLMSKIAIPFLLDPEYKKDGATSHHVVWHSIYLGLALHPEIRENYSNAIYDNAIYGLSRGVRVHGPVCSDENMRGNPIKIAVKKWLCDDAHRWVFEIIYAIKHPMEYQPNDQDGYSAAFKWLHDHGISEYYLFNFRPEENVDYKKYFVWFNYNSQTNKKGDFPWQEEFKWARYESVLMDVTKDVVLKHPLQVMQNVFIDKPIRYLCVYFFYTPVNHFPLLLLPITLFHFFVMRRHLPRNEILQGFKLLAVIFLFSLIPPLLVYPSTVVSADSALIFTMCIFYPIFTSVRLLSRNL